VGGIERETGYRWRIHLRNAMNMARERNNKHAKLGSEKPEGMI